LLGPIPINPKTVLFFYYFGRPIISCLLGRRRNAGHGRRNIWYVYEPSQELQTLSKISLPVSPNDGP